MEWYIVLLIIVFVLVKLSCLLRLCLCTLDRCTENEENVAPVSRQAPEHFITIRTGPNTPAIPLPPP